MPGNQDMRHCASCNKSVFNFAQASHEEILSFLAQRAGQKTCGMFEQSQLNSINMSINGSTQSKLYKPLVLATTVTTLLACGTTKQVYHTDVDLLHTKLEIVKEISNPDSTNTIVIEGIVCDESNMPLIGATVGIDETKIGCQTDSNGKFRLTIDKDDLHSQTAYVYHVAYAPMQVSLVDMRNREVKIVLPYDGVVLGEIDIVEEPYHKRMWNNLKNRFR